MSKYYGTLSSDAGKDRTKTGHTDMQATAQTCEGSVTVDICDYGDGVSGRCVRIYVRRGSGVGGFCLGEWSLEEFVLARELAIIRSSDEI